jgi:hypothetical protein
MGHDGFSERLVPAPDESRTISAIFQALHARQRALPTENPPTRKPPIAR